MNTVLTVTMLVALIITRCSGLLVEKEVELKRYKKYLFSFQFGDHGTITAISQSITVNSSVVLGACRRDKDYTMNPSLSKEARCKALMSKCLTCLSHKYRGRLLTMQFPSTATTNTKLRSLDSMTFSFFHAPTQRSTQ